jgi:hypothetical protein
MKGYVVFLANREYTTAIDNEELAKVTSEWLFVDVEETKEKYAIPSAFSKYAEYLNLVLGKEAIINELRSREV